MSWRDESQETTETQRSRVKQVYRLVLNSKGMNIDSDSPYDKAQYLRSASTLGSKLQGSSMVWLLFIAWAFVGVSCTCSNEWPGRSGSPSASICLGTTEESSLGTLTAGYCRHSTDHDAGVGDWGGMHSPWHQHRLAVCNAFFLTIR